MLGSELIQKYATMPEYFSKNGYITISKGKIFHKHAIESRLDKVSGPLIYGNKKGVTRGHSKTIYTQELTIKQENPSDYDLDMIRIQYNKTLIKSVFGNLQQVTLPYLEKGMKITWVIRTVDEAGRESTGVKVVR